MSDLATFSGLYTTLLDWRRSSFPVNEVDGHDMRHMWQRSVYLRGTGACPPGKLSNSMCLESVWFASRDWNVLYVTTIPFFHQLLKTFPILSSDSFADRFLKSRMSHTQKMPWQPACQFSLPPRYLLYLSPSISILSPSKSIHLFNKGSY